MPETYMTEQGQWREHHRRGDHLVGILHLPIHGPERGMTAGVTGPGMYHRPGAAR
ncbi:MAG: hypothetical protein JWP48_5912 [Actinoallomurus sp.]|jgi:hypothetical protein|nr:hypothetical protein [Actinoallomurus sp.]